MTKIDPPAEEIPTTVSINGVDYPIEEAQSFIEKGKQTSELEKQWNTSVDKVWPEYGKTREELKTIQAERDEARRQLQEFQNKKDAGTETKQDEVDAKEAARKLGLVLGEDLEKAGYIKKDDLPGLFQTYTQEQAAVREILDKATELEKEIDGSDGRPKFNKKAVLAYASAYNISDLKEAYEDMNRSEVDAWKTKQVQDQKNKGISTLGGGGQKQVKETKVTDDNVGDLLKEALNGGGE